MNTCVDCGREIKRKSTRCHSCANRRIGLRGKINEKGQFVPKHAPIQIGERFDKWVVLGLGEHKHNQQKWKVRCDCGFETEVASQHLRGKKSTCCIKCSGKKHSQKAFERNFGYYCNNRRIAHIGEAVKILYETQRGICPVCGEQLPQDLTKCAWDHDHITGEGRDLLHKGCNVFLGFIERNSSRLNRVIDYCKKYKIAYGS